MTKLEKIEKIHQNCRIVDNVLYLRGDVEGKNLEEINKIWNGKISVENLVGTYNHDKNIPLTVCNNIGKIIGDLSNFTYLDRTYSNGGTFLINEVI